MAITYPLNLLDDLPGWSTSFELMYRQELSRHASGRTRVKDFGTPIWTASYTTKNLSPNKLDYWRARLNLLENGLNTFIAYPLSRCRPIKHPEGVGVPSAPLVNSINANGKALSLKAANGLNLSVGDYISVKNILYNVMEDAVASSGVTPQFEVRPHLSLTTLLNDPVLIIKPRCLMTLVPGSVSTTSGLNGRASVSFQAIEARG